MSIFTTLAQYSYDYDYTYTNSDVDPAVVGIVIVFFFLFYFILAAALYVVTSLCLGKIFKKAGLKQWIAWVPFYNTWKMLEIGGQQGFWSVLMIVPFVNIASIVFVYIAMYHIGKKLGKEGVFVLLGIFLQLVWLIWLAVDKSTWNDKASSAPSLDPLARHGKTATHKA